MATNDVLPRRPLATYRRSHPVEDEETVPDSEDSISPGQSRPHADDSRNPTSSPIKDARSPPPRPPRAVYRSRKRAPSPLPLSYSSMAPVEEVIPDSEDNSRTVGTSDDDGDGDDKEKGSPSNARQSVSSGLSDWKQKLRDIDDQYDSDECMQKSQEISRAMPDPKEAYPEDPFGSPLTTEPSSQHTSSRLRADESLSSPSRLVPSSTNTTPHFLFGTPRTPSPSPPTSDGKPSPMSKTRTKGKGKARAHTKAHEAVIDDQLASSPNAIRQRRRSEKPKKSKAPTKKELLEARRETARLRSDMRASISTDATRPLDIKTLLKRFDVNQPAPSTRPPLQPHSSASEIEAWTSSSPASARDLEQSRTHQDDGAEASQHRQHISGRRSASPFGSADLLAPMSKYKVGSALDQDQDDPFCNAASSSVPKGTGTDRDVDSSSDVEMPGIGDILAQKADESRRAQMERLRELKLAAIAREQQKTASTSAGSPPGAEQDSDDDGLDVVSDTMHSVAREEAAARAAAGRTRPSAGRTTQLRLAHVAASPQRSGAHPLIPTDSPEKLMAAAAQPAFLSSLARGNGAAAGRGKRNAGMTKADLERMVLRNAEAQSEQLRREKEEEWVRRGGHVVGIMEDVGEEKVKELIGEALERSEDAATRGGEDAGSDDGDDDDADYDPTERGSASPRQEQREQEEVPMPIEETGAYVDEQPGDDNDGIAEAAALAVTEVDSETETESGNARLGRRTARPRHAIIGSDDEDGPPEAEHANEENICPPPLSLPDLPSPAFTSIASPWPTGNAEPIDHDNDPDVSGNDTDKENRAVERHGGSAPTHGARVLFDDILSARAGMGSVMQPNASLTDDDPFAFTPSPAKAREQVLRRLGSPAPRHFPSKRGLSQMFEEEEGNGFAPVPALMIQGVDGERATPSEADPGLSGFKPPLGGLSQAFEQTQDVSGSGTGMGGLAALRRGADAELSLTFEAQAAALQPALEVDDSLLARAAAIFEKEQEYVLEAAQPAPSRARRELYITENGFLTQTRPEGSSPLMYRPSPSQRPYDTLLRSQSDGTFGTTTRPGTGPGTAASSPLVTRQPLSTLAESSPMSSSVGREPLRRLRRAHTSPDGPVPASAAASPRQYGYPRRASLSPSPSPSRAKAKGAAAAKRTERTAFGELMIGAAAQRDNLTKKKLSEFVEDQAVESDEEDMLGFGGVRKKGANDDEDEEDDDHDAEGVVKALVDDAQMDDAKLAKLKVLEKHLEQQTADDARLEKEVQDVVAGKRRTRRRGGAGGLLGSDESDDDDDEEARALRQRLAKKRRITGDTLDELARDPAMASFHATYQMALVDDAEEFAHLDRDQELDTEPQQDRDQGEREGGDNEDDGQDDDSDRGENNRRRKRGNGEEQEEEDEDVEMAESSTGAGKGKEISAAEVRKALQEVARGEREYHALDPEDVSWMDQDLDESETLRVRLASSHTSTSKAAPRAQLQSADADMDVLSLNRTHADDQQDAAFAQRMKRWAKEEGAANRHGAGGSRGGGRSTGMAVSAGAAVTGHPRRSAGAGAGATAKSKSVKKAASSAAVTATATASAVPVRKTASALSAVADRRGRFGT